MADEYFNEPAISVPEHGNSENINGIFPDKIYIKTSTQCFNKYYQFLISEGRIYYKGLNPGEEPNQWTLLHETGIPEHSFHRFPTPERVTEISADLDSLIAMDEKGLIYEYYFVRNTVRQHKIWFSSMGFPRKRQLKLNSITGIPRSWASATRRAEILWYEDAFQNQHHFGAMGIETFYFLTEDGREIRFTDSGLPADLSRSIMLPERGRFTSRALSASGSTIMVINDAGEIYTRLADFDTIGCDPMFYLYTYENHKQPYPGWKYKSNFTEWGLPGEDWFKQPDILLERMGKITSHITILQTGQGNFARELRVAGISPDGKHGYYFKNLTDSGWNFQEAPLEIDECKFLDTTLDRELVRGKEAHLEYFGELDADGETLYLHIPNFSMSEGYCTLNLNYKEEKCSITVYPVEVWSYMFRENPGFDGIPKAFFITFDTCKLNTDSFSHEFMGILDKLFISRNLETFSAHALATQNFIKIDIPEKNDENIEIVLTKAGENKTDYTMWYNQTEFKNTALEAYSKLNLDPTDNSIESIRKALEDSCTYLKLLKAELSKYGKYSSSSELSRTAYGALDAIAHLTLLNYLNYPKIRTLMVHGSKIFRSNYEQYALVYDKMKMSYNHLEELLDAKIASYETALNGYKHDGTLTLNPLVRNTFQEYFQEINLNQDFNGKSKVLDSEAELFICHEIPFFPGFVLKTQTLEFPVLIEIENSVNKIMNSLKKEKFRPITFTVKLHNPALEELDGEKAFARWDGKKLRIYSNQLEKKDIFIGYAADNNQ